MQTKHRALRDHQITGGQKNLAQQLDQVFRTITKHQTVGVNTRALGNRVAQRRAVGVGVVAHIVGHIGNHLVHGGAQAKRVLIAGQTCDVRHAIARAHGFVGQTSVVGGQRAHFGAGQRGHQRIRHRSNTFPGFIRPCGSSAFLMADITASSAGVRLLFKNGFLCRPIPCSAETLPCISPTMR